MLSGFRSCHRPLMNTSLFDDLKGSPLFSVLAQEQLARVMDRHLEISYESEQLIVIEQDWGESVFLLRSGLAKVRTTTMDGDEVVMSLLGEGDLFGEMAVLDSSSRSADVVALTPLKLVKLRVAPFVQLLEEHASFALNLARFEAARLKDMNRRFAVQNANATSRMLDSLAYLARKSSGVINDSQALIPSLAVRELALVAGLARETASRTLSKLRSRGTVIEEEGRLRLVDLQPLQKRGLLV